MVASLFLSGNCGAASPQQVKSGQIVSVCEAGKQPIGTIITVRGEFDGFGYETRSRRIVISSSGVCPGVRGAGQVFAEMVTREEADKLANARPRSSRRGTPGDTVTIRGTVKKIDDGRFVALVDAVVAR